MANKKEYEDYYKIFLTISIGFLAVNIYYFSFSLWHTLGLEHKAVTSIFLTLRSGGWFNTPFKTKIIALMLGITNVLTKHGKSKKSEWWQIGVSAVAGALMYFIWFKDPIIYIISTIGGFLAIIYSVAMLVQKLTKFDRMTDDIMETFQQCDELIENDDSINLPTIYRFEGKLHHGWINITAPFAGTLVTGVPGTGKSYSVFLPFAEQMIQKGYTMFVYDYKYPVLSYDIYNMLLQNAHCYVEKGYKVPKFYTINFKDPRYSHRCNPLNRIYLPSLTDCTEVAKVLMDNLAETDKKDFFSQSAELYTDCCISFLWLYKDGKYCSFPHLVELMCCPPETITGIISSYPQLSTKVASFKDALKKGANEQLAGQVSSATVPLAGMSTPALYWTLSADDFTLDISNPDSPKVVCLGNDPDNQAVYGAASALFFSRLFKKVNHPGNQKTAILFDEAPTVKVKNIENLIATARSNKVAIVFGGQDFSQFVKDYKKEYANVLFGTVGNIISGRVNRETAEDFSKMFGKRFREHRGQTISDENESMNVSYSQDDIMPRSKIETLSTGTFFGKVGDTFTEKVPDKFFCAEIQIDRKHVEERQRRSVPIPQFTSFNEDLYRRSIIDGDLSVEELATLGLNKNLKEDAKYELAREILHSGNIYGYDNDLNYLDNTLAGIKEADINDYLEEYANNYIERLIPRVLNENYNSIKEDIATILAEHGY